MLKTLPIVDVVERVCRLLATITLMFAATAAHAQTYADLHDFGGTVINTGGISGPDGIYPDRYWGNRGGGVTFDSAGNMYGVAPGGGPFQNIYGYGYGMLWELTAASEYTDYIDLHDFGGTVTNADGLSGPDGEYPDASVTFDSKGNMYGTCWGGGPSASYSPHAGMVWELTAASGYTQYIDLHDFGGTVILSNGQPGTDGGLPISTVTVDKAGDLYGTTSYGGLFKHGAGQGMLWEIEANGTYLDLHDFGGPITLSDGAAGYDGTYPAAGVAIDTAGDLYGTTPSGGEWGGIAGILWEYTASGAYKDLHDFGGTITDAEGQASYDGEYAQDVPTIDNSGDLYGTTALGGPYTQQTGGIAWEMTSGGAYIDLHDFGGTLPGGTEPDGGDPVGSVTIDESGNLFGTTPAAGPGSDGNIWEISNTGSYSVLHAFNGTIDDTTGVSVNDGFGPDAGVTLDAHGNLYGVTNSGGGANNDGIAWTIVESLVPPTITPPAGEYITSLSVNISETTPDAIVYYTTDGSTPSPGLGTTKAYAGPFTLYADATVQAIAVIGGGVSSAVSESAYVVRAADPVFSQGSRHICSPIDITITDPTPNASIYYTLDGSAPTPGAAGTFHYHGVPVVVEPGDTLEAIATIVGGHRSGTKIAVYTAIPAPAAPTFSPSPGEYVTEAFIGIFDSTAGVKLYYTTDGSTPSPGAGTTQQYVGSIPVTENTTVKAIAAYTSGAGVGPVANAAYTVQAADPVITPGAENITVPTDISMSDATPGASIYYTLDGSAPSPGSAGTYHYHGVPVQIEPITTVEVLATLPGGKRSNTIVAVYE